MASQSENTISVTIETIGMSSAELNEIDNAIRNYNFPFLRKYMQDTRNGDLPRVNLSNDPLLNVMISYGSDTDVLLALIAFMSPEALMAKNEVGDTALHVAAAKNEMTVATDLIFKIPYLIKVRNNKLETPLLQAAFFGSTETLNILIRHSPDSIHDRSKSGANVLQYAILGNHLDLALSLVQEHRFLMDSRDVKGLTPLHVIATLPQAFLSNMDLGPAESFIYKLISLNNCNKSEKLVKPRDDEKHGPYIPDNYPAKNATESDKVCTESKAMFRSKFLKMYRRYVAGGVFKVVSLIIFILKKFSNRVEELAILKENHVQTTNLIAHLAQDRDYWDFFNKGMSRNEHTKMFSAFDDADKTMDFVDDDDDDDGDDVEIVCPINAPFNRSLQTITNSLQNQTNLIMKQNILIKELKKEIKSKNESEPLQWNESPLIVGAKMGLQDFVEQILKVCPQSFQFKDFKGRNILQVAIKQGHTKIVDIITEMILRPNPVLPPSLLWDYEDDKKNNTILHYAAETTIEGLLGFALQMQREIKWFERVKKLLPKDLVNNRNVDGKTAQELFNDNHAEMVKNGRDQLMDVGKTCSSLLAAVVFATSFNIPQGKGSDSVTKPSNNSMTNIEGNHFNDKSVGFKVFSHAYMVGLSCATCSLLLFLSLLISNYSVKSFRRSLPTKFMLAIVTFLLALLALLVAFTSNIYLSIYGAPKVDSLLPFILELIGFPFMCAIAWFFGGFGIPFTYAILSRFRR